MVYKVHNLAFAYLSACLLPPKLNHKGFSSSSLHTLFAVTGALLCILQSISFSSQAHRELPFQPPLRFWWDHITNGMGVRCTEFPDLVPKAFHILVYIFCSPSEQLDGRTSRQSFCSSLHESYPTQLLKQLCYEKLLLDKYLRF